VDATWLQRIDRPQNTWKINLETEMWTAGYKYSWRKMEAVAQNRAKDTEELSVAHVPPGVSLLIQ